MSPVESTEASGVSVRSAPVPAEEAETRALIRIQKALAPLTAESRIKVLAWFIQRFPTQSPGRNEPSAKGDFQDLSDLFQASVPKTEAERVLAACFFHNQVRNEAEVGARMIANELVQMGHDGHNVSRTLRDLNTREPALVMVASKSGTGKGSKYRYRVTSAGARYVAEMLKRQVQATPNA